MFVSIKRSSSVTKARFSVPYDVKIFIILHICNAHVIKIIINACFKEAVPGSESSHF